MATPPTLCTLWIGPALGAMERACLLSAVRQGHPVTLYCYQRTANIPPEVEVADAAEIVPESSIIRHHSGSISLFSNLFRYELLKKGKGTWIDSDVYVVRPIPDEDYVFGWEGGRSIGSAILRLPPTAPILVGLTQIFTQRLPPRWLSLRASLASWMRLMINRDPGLSSMPWGTAGPAALTALTRNFGLQHHAADRSVFYPVAWQDANWIFNPTRCLEDVVRPNTITVHLWNEVTKGRKHLPAPPGSFLARLREEGA